MCSAHGKAWPSEAFGKSILPDDSFRREGRVLAPAVTLFPLTKINHTQSVFPVGVDEVVTSPAVAVGGVFLDEQHAGDRDGCGKTVMGPLRNI